MTRIIRRLAQQGVAHARSWVVLAAVVLGLGVWAGAAQVFTLDPAGGTAGSNLVSGSGVTDRSLRAVSSDCIEVRLSGYNLFLLEDYAEGTDVQGRVAAGGNITLNYFTVGQGLPDSDIAQALVAGGNLSLSNGGVHGDAWYGGSYTASSVSFTRGSASQGTPIDFAARGAELRSLSSQLGGLPVNGTMTRESWGGVMLRGTDPAVNVFDVDASAFIGAALLSIDAPAGSLAIINIHGTSATFTGFSQIFGGGLDQHGVLFNFVEATAITVQGYGFWGTVLAPNAQVRFSNGSFDGGIYARSLTGNAAGHINPLTDRDVCATSGPVNSPPSVAITSPANGASFKAPATISIVAAASDSDGTVSQVEFFRDGTLVGTATSAPYAVTLTAVPAGTYSLTAKATDDLGASTTSAAVVVSVQGLGLTITSPVNGASINGDHVIVKGHISGVSNAGVTVNGVVAAIDGNQDFSARVPLSAGGNTLTARLTSLDGVTLEQSVTVVATGQSSPFTVIVDPTVGLAPLAVTFTVKNPTGQPASYTFDGAGSVSLPPGGTSSRTVTYPVGVFSPTIVVTDSGGHSFSQSWVVEARDANQMDLLFSAIWNGMNTALLAGDKEKALTYLNDGGKKKYGPVFDALMPFMPEIISSYSPLARASISSTIGEYAIRRSDNGTYRLYFIYFLQDFDGVWRIDEM